MNDLADFIECKREEDYLGYLKHSTKISWKGGRKRERFGSVWKGRKFKLCI